MDQRNPAGEGQAGFQGQVSGQVRVRSFRLVVGSPEGAFVLPSLAGEEGSPQPQLAPPLPRRPAAFLGRELELNQAAAGLQSGGVRLVELYGPPGIGRTAFLRALASHPAAKGFRDGVIYLNAAGQPREDLLLSLFDAFFETQLGSRPDEDGARRALQDCRALVLLDDAGLAAGEMESLAGAAPGCVFVIASTQRQLLGAGASLALRGLEDGAGLELFETGLGRPLRPEERGAAETQCAALGGNPLYILQAAAFSRYADLQAQGGPSSPAWFPSPERLKAQILASLSQAERPLVYNLAALEGAPMGAAHLAALAGLPEAAPLLDGLGRRNVVKIARGRYSLAGDLNEEALNTWDLSEWKSHLATYFADWAEKAASDPASLAEEAEPMLRLAAWAAGTGRDGEALRLAHNLEGALALEGRWGAWRQALTTGLSAAQGLGGRGAEARALHQLGARALVLGQEREARGYLVRALRLRESLGDQGGQAATRQNLDLALGSQVATRPVSIPAELHIRLPRRAEGLRSPIPFVLLALAVLLLGSLAGILWLRSGRPGVPTDLIETLSGPLATGKAPGDGEPGGLPPGSGGLTFLPLILDPSAGPEAATATISPRPTTSGLQFPAYTIVPPTPVTPGTTQPVTAAPTTPTFTLAPGGGSACGLPTGWVSYQVQANDSIPLVAAETGVTPEILMVANCMNGLYWLTPGDRIYVPRLPSAAVAATQTRAALGTGAVKTSATNTSTATPSPTAPPQRTATATAGAPSTSAAGVCLQFADLPRYQVYSNTDSFVTSGVKVNVGSFTTLDGHQTTSGVAEIELSQDGGGSQDVHINSASLSFAIPSPVNGLSLGFINFGGSVNVEINGDLRNLSKLAALDGQAVGGALIHITSGENEGQGTLDLSGKLTSFRIGGQDMWVEQACFK